MPRENPSSFYVNGRRDQTLATFTLIKMLGVRRALLILADSYNRNVSDREPVIRHFLGLPEDEQCGAVNVESEKSPMANAYAKAVEIRQRSTCSNAAAATKQLVPCGSTVFVATNTGINGIPRKLSEMAQTSSVVMGSY